MTSRCVMQPPSKKVEPFSGVTTTFESADAAHADREDGIKNKNGWQVLPDMWETLTGIYADQIALSDPHRDGESLTYSQLEESIKDFSHAIASYGVVKSDCVALFAENSHRWLVADQGIMMAGACNAVRGASRSSVQELAHIAAHSDSCALVLEDATLLQKLVPSLRQSSLSARFKFVVLLWGDKPIIDLELDSEALPFPVFTFAEFLMASRTARAMETAAVGASKPRVPVALRPDDVATLVYTSGTTGNPKAVMLTHANLLHQVSTFSSVISPTPGDLVLSLLPPWHMYERSCEYFCLSCGVHQVYSSIKTFRDDLTLFPPDFFVAVPLVLETLYNGVQKKLRSSSAVRSALAAFLLSCSLARADALRVWRCMDLGNVERRGHKMGAADKEGLTNGGDGTGTAQSFAPSSTPVPVDRSAVAGVGWLLSGLAALLLFPLYLLADRIVLGKIRSALGIKKAIISGGGSLSPHVDKFFEAVGITLLNGYGLTETSPVLTCRTPICNVLGSVGHPLPGTEIRITDPETGETLPPGWKGIVKARGPQVMRGYYKDPAATAAAIDPQGWYNTGDLGWLAPPAVHPLPFVQGGRSHSVLVLDGRAKDTIVLASGENVEPTKIEEALLRSRFIHQVMVVGQDQRRLGALIFPQEEELEGELREQRRKKANSRVGMESTRTPAVDLGEEGELEATVEEKEALIRQEIIESLNGGDCTMPHEHISSFVLLTQPFTIENGLLTPTMKMRRDHILEAHKDKVDRIFGR